MRLKDRQELDELKGMLSSNSPSLGYGRKSGVIMARYVIIGSLGMFLLIRMFLLISMGACLVNSTEVDRRL